MAKTTERVGNTTHHCPRALTGREPPLRYKSVPTPTPVRPQPLVPLCTAKRRRREEPHSRRPASSEEHWGRRQTDRQQRQASVARRSAADKQTGEQSGKSTYGAAAAPSATAVAGRGKDSGATRRQTGRDGQRSIAGRGLHHPPAQRHCAGRDQTATDCGPAPQRRGSCMPRHCRAGPTRSRRWCTGMGHREDSLRELAGSGSVGARNSQCRR